MVNGERNKPLVSAQEKADISAQPLLDIKVKMRVVLERLKCGERLVYMESLAMKCNTTKLHHLLFSPQYWWDRKNNSVHCRHYCGAGEIVQISCG